eukprot:4823375-Amphidinium_carterae.1
MRFRRLIEELFLVVDVYRKDIPKDAELDGRTKRICRPSHMGHIIMKIAHVIACQDDRFMPSICAWTCHPAARAEGAADACACEAHQEIARVLVPGPQRPDDQGMAVGFYGREASEGGKLQHRSRIMQTCRKHLERLPIKCLAGAAGIAFGFFTDVHIGERATEQNWRAGRCHSAAAEVPPLQRLSRVASKSSHVLRDNSYSGDTSGSESGVEDDREARDTTPPVISVLGLLRKFRPILRT